MVDEVMVLFADKGYLEQEVIFQAMNHDVEITKTTLSYLVRKKRLGLIRYKKQQNIGVIYYIKA